MKTIIKQLLLLFLMPVWGIGIARIAIEIMPLNLLGLIGSWILLILDIIGLACIAGIISILGKREREARE